MSAILQTTSGDFDLTSKNLRIVSDLATVTAQKAADMLNLFLGEWFLDSSQGTPWFQLILGVKNPDFNLIRSALRKRMLSVPGVSAVKDISFNWIPSKREVDYSVSLVLSTGQTITIPAPTP